MHKKHIKALPGQPQDPFKAAFARATSTDLIKKCQESPDSCSSFCHKGHPAAITTGNLRMCGQPRIAAATEGLSLNVQGLLPAAGSSQVAVLRIEKKTKQNYSVYQA